MKFKYLIFLCLLGIILSFAANADAAENKKLTDEQIRHRVALRRTELENYYDGLVLEVTLKADSDVRRVIEGAIAQAAA